MKKLVVAAVLAAIGLAFATSGEEAAYAVGKDPNDEYGMCTGKPKPECWHAQAPFCDCMPGETCYWSCQTNKDFSCGGRRPFCDDRFTKMSECECEPSVGCWWACPKPPPAPPVYKTCREAPGVKCFAGLHPSCSCSEKTGCAWECPL